MPKKILPGQSSEDFPAIQERNIEALLKVLNKKEATNALKGLGEIDRESWVNMNATVATLKEIVDLGGASVVVGDIKEHIKEVLLANIDLALAPIKNEISIIITDYLKPLYDVIYDVTSDLTPFIQDYKSGAFMGAMVGSIWGEGTTIIGGLIGAGLEAFFRFIFWDLWWDHWPDMMTAMVKAIKDWWIGSDSIFGIPKEDFEELEGW